MAAHIPNTWLDAYLLEIAGTRMHFCSALPADYAAIAAVELAARAVLPAQHTLADGNVSGRKLITAAQFDVPVTVGGVCTHIVMSNGTDELFRSVTCTPHRLTAGGVFNSPSFELTILAPQ